MINNDTQSPYGRYRPNWWQRTLIGFSRSMPAAEITYRLALAMKRPLLALTKTPLDVETFGAKVRFYPHDNICERRALLTPNRFDPSERQALASAVPTNGVFVDLGANCGLYSLFMAQAVGYHGIVVAVEPQPRVYERLVFNMRASGLKQIRPLRLGVSDQRGTRILHEKPDNRGEATLSELHSSDGNSYEVEVKPLLELLSDIGITQVDALKIDIERHEDYAMAPFMVAATDDLLPNVIVTENSRDHWKTDWIELALDRGYEIAAENRMNITLRRNALGSTVLLN